MMQSTLPGQAAEQAALSPILAAALDAFDEHGYHGATVRDIARRVGLTVPALYYHHTNKEAMLFALLDASITRLNELCRQVDEPGIVELERFDALVRCLVQYTAVSRKLSRLDHEIRSLSDDHRHGYSSKRAAIEKRLLSVVRSGIRSGVFDAGYPADTVRALLGSIQAIPTWYDVNGKLSLDALVRRYVAIAHRMLGVR